MTKLNAIVAIEKGVREAFNKASAPLFHSAKVPALFAGITQTFKPLEEGGTTLPDDNTEVQLTVKEILDRFRITTTRLLDVMSTKEDANTSARSDVVVDGETLLENVPVVFLIQLENMLKQEVRGLITSLPTLDPADTWSPSAASRAGIYETSEFQTFRTKKVQKPIVLYDATDKHPAQTQLITEDVIDGYWHKKKFSGAISAARKQELVDRLENLITAFKQARERANDVEVTDRPIGDKVFDHLFA